MIYVCNNGSRKELIGLNGPLLMSGNDVPELCEATHPPAWLFRPRGLTFVLVRELSHSGRGRERGHGRPACCCLTHRVGTPKTDRAPQASGDKYTGWQLRGGFLAGSEEVISCHVPAARGALGLLTTKESFRRASTPNLRLVTWRNGKS